MTMTGAEMWMGGIATKMARNQKGWSGQKQRGPEAERVLLLKAAMGRYWTLYEGLRTEMTEKERIEVWPIATDG